MKAGACLSHLRASATLSLKEVGTGSTRESEAACSRLVQSYSREGEAPAEPTKCYQRCVRNRAAGGMRCRSLGPIPPRAGFPEGSRQLLFRVEVTAALEKSALA